MIAAHLVVSDQKVRDVSGLILKSYKGNVSPKYENKYPWSCIKKKKIS